MLAFLKLCVRKSSSVMLCRHRWDTQVGIKSNTRCGTRLESVRDHTEGHEILKAAAFLTLRAKLCNPLYRTPYLRLAPSLHAL